VSLWVRTLKHFVLCGALAALAGCKSPQENGSLFPEGQAVRKGIRLTWVEESTGPESGSSGASLSQSVLANSAGGGMSSGVGSFFVSACVDRRR
jgi:hypothetical protein